MTDDGELPAAAVGRRGGSEDPTGMRLVADPTLRRVGPGRWLGGSPSRLFRVRDAGDRVLRAVRDAGADGAPAAPVGGARARLLDHLVAAGALHPRPAARQAAGGEVTVVVPVRDRPDGLDALLASLAACRPVAAVVVVDDGSSDAEAHERVAVRHGARYLRRDLSGGPGVARNDGAALVSTPLVAFLDSDVRVTPGWLAALVGHFDDAGVAIVAPRVRPEGGHGLLGRYEAGHSPLDMGPDPAGVVPGGRVSYLPAAALVVRISTLRELGGFDPAMRVGEDVDLVWRAVEAGWRVRYEPGAEVSHDVRPGWAPWWVQRVSYGSSAADLEVRHPGAVAPVVLSPWSAGVWAAAATGHPAVGAVLAAGTAVALARKLREVPAPLAVRLAMAGHLGAGRALARAALRAWWPLVAVACVLSRRARRVALVAVTVHIATSDGPAAERLVAVLDDVAYGTGLWRGALRSGSLRCLLARRRPGG